MPDPYDQIIMKFPLFDGYTAFGTQQMLQRGEIRKLKPGETLFREGDAATAVALVLTGQLQVFLERKGRDLHLTNAEPGTILGEIGVLCGLSRTASIRAVNDATVLQWPADSFRSMLLSDHMLSERIFRQSLRTLIEKERSMIDALVRSQ